MNAEQRIRKGVEGWFITEPLLFGVWTLHRLVESTQTRTIRVGTGRIEFNPAFVQALPDGDLREVLRLEAIRILLKHPYSRQKPIPSFAYLASNITLAEYISTSLPLPRAREVFQSTAFDRQYYELYYEQLIERAAQGRGTGESSPAPAPGRTQPPGASTGADPAPGRTQPPGVPGGRPGEDPDGDAADDRPLERYVDANASGPENTRLWHYDEFEVEEIDARIREAQQSDSWGTLTGRIQERILATLVPKVSYRKMLRAFRASIVSSRRTLTRMKPSRRYDFEYMGHRFAFSTRLLVAVDVSGSIHETDLRRGFSVINQLFRYGIEHVDTLQFDTEIKGEVIGLRKARKHVQVAGRGGTSFEVVMDYVDEHREYDGLIVFTDGQAPIPRRPANRRTRVIWLFNTEHSYRAMAARLRPIGKATFIREGS